MQIWLKNVVPTWVEVVETLASPDELAIWQASGYRAWRVAEPGALVLFRPEGRPRAIVGHGIYVGTTLQFARDAHALFGVGLGVRSYDDLLAQVDKRRSRPDGPNPVIATALFRDPHIFPVDWPFELPWPLDVADTLVPLCSSAGSRGRDLLAGLRYHARPRTGHNEQGQERLADTGQGRPQGSRGRPGWSTFRSMTMRLYGHRCAITGERVSVVQDVIHLRPRSRGGADALGNLITAEANIHRLVERNLLAFDDDLRVMLSGQSNLFEDSKYLELDGLELRPRLFGAAWPDEASLRWLRDRFKGPRYRG